MHRKTWEYRDSPALQRDGAKVTYADGATEQVPPMFLTVRTPGDPVDKMTPGAQRARLTPHERSERVVTAVGFSRLVLFFG